MFWNPMLLTLYLLPFYTAALLRYASAHVARSNQDLVLVTPNSPVAPFHNGTTTSLPREDPPLQFKVDYSWQDGGKSFDHLAFCNTIVGNVAIVTTEPWNKDINIIQFFPTYNIRIGFVSDRSGPGLQLKHVVWALVELFDFLVEHNRFSVGNTVVNSNWEADRLAVGTITIPGSGFGLVIETNIPTISPLSSILGKSIMNTSMSDSNVTTPSPSLQLVNSTQSNMRTIQLPALKQTSEHVSSSSNAEDNIKIHIAYTPGGAAFHDVQIYNASLQLLVQITQVADQDGTIWPMISTYNNIDDFTLSVGPIGFSKHSEMSWGNTATVLAYMGQALSSQGVPGHVWAELEGILETDKVFKGVFYIGKGNRTR